MFDMRFFFSEPEMIRWDNSKTIKSMALNDYCVMALRTPIPPSSSSSKSLFSSNYLKPSNPLLVLSHSLRPKTHFLHTKSRKLRVEATAILDSGSGSVGLAPEKKVDESSSANPYGRNFFPSAAVVGQLCPCQRAIFCPISARSGLIWRVKSGRVRADVKSEPHDIAESPPDSVQFDKVYVTDDDEGGDSSTVPWWEEFPKRWVIVLLCCSAFLLCNMDRVNMSIAILPMSSEFHWSPTTVGLIQSSFFWGYLLTQVAGGIWADTVGGKFVLGFGVVWWSIATMLTPIAAKIGLPFLLVVRAFMGIGEGVAMPAMNNILSKWVPVSERSRSLALVYSGMYLGSVTGLAFSPMLIHKFGWPSVFYSFGSLGTLWFALWLNKAHSSPLVDPQLLPGEKKLILRSCASKETVKSIPWGLILSKAPVWALIVSHFCHNWGTFILLTWMPTYYHQVLKFNLTESSLFSVLPWLTMAFSANFGGWIADTLVSRGVSVTTVRKIMQTIGFLGPAFFLTQLTHVDSPAMAVLCMACSQGADAFSQSGLYSNHQDIAPRYSGVLLGLSNTAGVLAGVFGTAATGYILQHGSWDDVFKVSVGLYLVGTVVWNLFSTGEKILD